MVLWFVCLFLQFLRRNPYSLIWFPLHPVLIWWIVGLFLTQTIYEALVFLLPGSTFSAGTCVFVFWLGWPACFYHMKGISKSWQCLLVFTLESEMPESWYVRAWQSVSFMDCSQARVWPTPESPWSPIDGPLLLSKLLPAEMTFQFFPGMSLWHLPSQNLHSQLIHFPVSKLC